MRKIIILFSAVVLSVSCKKDKEAEPQQSGKLSELVPEAFLKEAKTMGFTVHEGNTPPNITGEYKLAPWRFDGDNDTDRPGGANQPGYTIANGFSLKIVGQQGSVIGVSYVGYYEGRTLNDPFIIGSGNNFTICRHIEMIGGMGGLFSHPYAQLISGTLDGGKLKNVKMATIGLKSNPGDAGAAAPVEGEIAIWSDADGVSE